MKIFHRVLFLTKYFFSNCIFINKQYVISPPSIEEGSCLPEEVTVSEKKFSKKINFFSLVGETAAPPPASQGGCVPKEVPSPACLQG